MPKIQNIQADQSITKDDKLLGSDSGGGTRNYVISDISGFFKDTNAAGIAGQLTYQYKNTTPYNAGSMRVTFSSGSTFQNITSIKVSKFVFGETTNSSENLLDIFASGRILIVDVADQDNFGIFDTSTVTQDNTETNFYNLPLNVTKSNGSLTNEKIYAIISIGSGADKSDTLSFSASDFDGTETVSGSSMAYIDFAHNLGKKPAITVTEQGSPNEVCLVPVKYINNNTVRVYFTGTTSGTIFAN